MNLRIRSLTIRLYNVVTVFVGQSCYYTECPKTILFAEKSLSKKGDKF